MCDTLVALGNSTVDGSVIFAKNSDREPNEAHHLLLVPAADYPAGSEVQSTYVRIPQAAHTHAVLLAKPFWIWGAEMGANEHGVVIGNEAVFTRVPYQKEPGLIGMDFLRLALERAANALDALRVMTTLLETYGQGGNCGLTHGFYYHNSFLIADTRDAWVLETAGKQWAAQQVRDIRTISNAITIGREWDLCSDGLVDLAVEKGWCRGRADFDFAACYSDPLYTRFSDARKRQCSTRDALCLRQGKLSPASAMDILRSHTSHSKTYTPDHGLTGAEVCMHAGFGPVRNSQSAGSMVSQLRDDSTVHWFTAASAPCTGIFFPVWMDAGLPDLGPQPDAGYNPDTYWWQHELLHREVLRNYSARIETYAGERDSLEEEFIHQAEACRLASLAERLKVSRNCVSAARNARAGWLAKVRAVPPGRLSLPYSQAWKSYNRQAKFPS